MSAAAVAAAAWGVSGAVGGEHWRPAVLAITPLVFGAWEGLRRDAVFRDFPWFAHATGAIAVLLMLSHDPTSWLWPATLASLSFAYLAWQAIPQHPCPACTGEAGTVHPAAALPGPTARDAARL